MFEKFDINSLYLAAVNVVYAEDYGWETNVGGVLMTGMDGYGYWTIVRQTEEEKVVDLQNPSYPISAERDSRRTSYMIDYIEPLSNYYTQSGKQIFSKRQVIKEASKHYDTINQKRYAMISEKQDSTKGFSK